MKHSFSTLAAFAGLSVATVMSNGIESVRNPDQELIFAFELVRHGARSPFEDIAMDKFPVGVGELTPEGMRQRYLLGRRNRERYTETFNLIPTEYDPKQVYIQSTAVNRTMQSGYSELLGLYPPGSGSAELTKDQIQAARPPFKVRDAEKINSELGKQALPNDFVAVPIPVYLNADIHDDVGFSGCPFIGGTEDLRVDDYDIFMPYNWMMEKIREPVRQMYNKTEAEMDELNYHHFYWLTDSAVALDYEGWPVHEEYFSDDQWETAHEFQKVYLSLRDTKDSRDLEASRVLRKPIDLMKKKVQAELDADAPVSDMKYVIYSAHDDQITTMWNFLGLDYYWIPYASTTTFELKYSASCLANEASDNCFGVSIYANGKPLAFDECTGDLFTLNGCSFPEFLALMESKWYSGPSADDLDQACMENPESPTN